MTFYHSWCSFRVGYASLWHQWLTAHQWSSRQIELHLVRTRNSYCFSDTNLEHFTYLKTLQDWFWLINNGIIFDWHDQLFMSYQRISHMPLIDEVKIIWDFWFWIWSAWWHTYGSSICLHWHMRHSLISYENCLDNFIFMFIV